MTEIKGPLGVQNSAGKLPIYMTVDRTVDFSVKNDSLITAIDLDGSRHSVIVRHPSNNDVMRFDGTNYHITITNSIRKRTFTLNGDAGDIDLFDKEGKRSIAIRGKAFDGNVTGMWIGAAIGDPGPKAGYVVLRDKAGGDSIILDGTIGDISLRNSDCAEEFEISGSSTVEPGTVMVIDNDGKLQASQKDYDGKVAGVISGAGNYKPGIVLGKGASSSSSATLALMGKVYCKVDAQYSQIDIGDMLTTSRTPGHAMRALDPMRAFGSVIGKSLGKIKEGRGLIPILVALQ